MDPITHGLIGAALTTFSEHPQQLNDPVFLGTVIGAMLPDLDIVTHLKGRLNYLLKHRGASHSLLALGGMALGLSSVLYAAFPSTPWNTIFFWTLIGTLSHGLSDLLNSFGAELLWPFYRKKITVNMIMLTDPVVLTLFLISLILSYFYPAFAKESSVTALALSALYLFYRELGRQKTRNVLLQRYHLRDKGQIKVLPAIYRPFNWNFLLFQKEFVCFGTFQNGEPQIQRILPRWDEGDPSIAPALEGELAEIFTKFTPHYHILRKQSEGEEWKIEFLDLRYWNKDNFLYKGEVIMNAQGEISEETFYLYPNEEGILLGY